MVFLIIILSRRVPRSARDSLPVFHVKQIEIGCWRFELGNNERFETNIKPLIQHIYRTAF